MRLPRISTEQVREVESGKVLRLPYGEGSVMVVYATATKIVLRPLAKGDSLETPDTAGEEGSQPQLL